MTELIDTVSAQLLAPHDLSPARLEGLLGIMLTHGIDEGEVFAQQVRAEAWSLEEGIVKDASFNVDSGVGVRALVGERTGFAYSDDMQWRALEQAAQAARSIARSGGNARVQVAARRDAPRRYQTGSPIISLQDTEKVALLQRLDALARSLDPRVREVSVSLVGRHESALVLSSDGTLAADIRPLVRLNVSVLVESGGRRERGSAGAGGRFDYNWFLSPTLESAHGLQTGPEIRTASAGMERAEALVREAVRVALVNLDAVDAPAGVFPVVLGPGWPGVLLHEAVGHGLEGDFNRKGTSTFAGRIGQQVASPLCTVVDDGTLLNRRGSLSMDDEGTPAGRTVLIENGILRGYLQDKLNARLLGVAPTGNGRRESYSHLPMPRMTNTFMLAGPHAPEEILRSVKRGLYAVNFAGGSVDITSGRFVFTTSEAYLIEDGRVTSPVKGATLIGNGPDVMNRISMVGNDLALDAGVGVCGKEGQSVPVGVGQPTLKVDEITIGGTG